MESKKKTKYVVILDEFLELDLKPIELMIYSIIYGFTQNDQTYSGSYDYLKKWCGCSSDTTIWNALRSLEEKGLIQKVNERREGLLHFCEYKSLSKNDIAHERIRTKKENDDDVLEALQKFIPEANAMWLEYIKHFEKMGLSNALIIHAIKQTAGNNVRSANYFKEICLSYIQKGYKTIDEVERAQAQFKNNQKRPNSTSKIDDVFDNYKNTLKARYTKNDGGRITGGG